MQFVLSHPTGNDNVRAAAVALQTAGMLRHFHTCLGLFPGTMFDALSALGPLREFRRRRFDTILKHNTITHPVRELGRLLLMRTRARSLTAHETGPFSIDAVFGSLDRSVSGSLKRSLEKIQGGVYAYEDGARQSFQTAKSLGRPCVYDLPIGYWRTARRILQVEQERLPAWASTLTGLKDSEIKLANKDEELRLADLVIVASSFTAKTLDDYPGPLSAVQVVPYGFPAVNQTREYDTIKQRPLKVLFVGGLSQRKGISYLFEAAGRLASHIELTVVGNKVGPSCLALDQALTRHRWIPSLPHNEILKLMRQHDVFVFPSLFEGFGLVISEAMSQGTPVITTDRTAGPDIIEQEENGWLIEAGSSEALQQTLEELLRTPGKIKKAGMAAQHTARQRPWEQYGRELVAALQNHFKP